MSETFRVVSPLGDHTQYGNPVSRVCGHSVESFTQRGFGALLALQTFGAEYAEPYIRWAWQNRIRIVEEAPDVMAPAFEQAVALRVGDDRRLTLPWHPDTFTAIYVLVLAVNGHYGKAHEISQATPATDATCVYLVGEVLYHAADKYAMPEIELLD